VPALGLGLRARPRRLPGVEKIISLRGDNKALKTTKEEKANYTDREATYYGNVFIPGQPKFVCLSPGKKQIRAFAATRSTTARWRCGSCNRACDYEGSAGGFVDCSSSGHAWEARDLSRKRDGVSAEVDEVIGRTVAGRFYLEHLAGAGGMGAVYRARDVTDGEIVAVKILTGRELREAERFDLEAAILADLTHPAIVRYIAHGVEGRRPLHRRWSGSTARTSRRASTAHRSAVVDAVAMARRASEALGYAHARGIVHRDIKPENLFLPGGSIARLKVLDFGIARLTRGGRKLTLTGSVIGTPGYMAPELVRGVRDIKPSADVFSLGCVLFQCLTGRPVFEAEEATALLAKILLQDAPRARDFAPGLPKELDEAVARMLAKDPAKRLADARAVIAALDEIDVAALESVASADHRRRAQPALTATEQRIACVVIAGAHAHGGAALVRQHAARSA
jgi:hypothetical protein